MIVLTMTWLKCHSVRAFFTQKKYVTVPLDISGVLRSIPQTINRKTNEFSSAPSELNHVTPDKCCGALPKDAVFGLFKMWAKKSY